MIIIWWLFIHQSIETKNKLSFNKYTRRSRLWKFYTASDRSIFSSFSVFHWTVFWGYLYPSSTQPRHRFASKDILFISAGRVIPLSDGQLHSLPTEPDIAGWGSTGKWVYLSEHRAKGNHKSFAVHHVRRITLLHTTIH